MAEDAGSIQSAIRIDYNSLSGDISRVETLYDNMEHSIKQSLSKSEKAIQKTATAQKQGAISQEQALKRVMNIRKAQIELLEKEAVRKGTLTKKEMESLKALRNQYTMLTAQQKKLTSSTDQNTEANNDNSDSFASQARSMFLLAGAIRAIKKGMDVFKNTEQTLANVKAVTGATAKEFDLLKTSALEAGETTRFTAQQSAEALYNLTSAGLDATQATQALNDTLLLAGATGSDLAETAKSMTSTMSQYKIPAGQAGRITNTFAAAIANSQANMDKLTNSLRQVGSVAGLMGISLEETVGSLQLLYNAGYQGANAGRALKSALADLGNSGSSTAKKLRDDFGIAFKEIDPAQVGLTGAIERLSEAQLTAAESLDVFGKVAGGQMATLISAGREEIEKYTEAVTGTNAATEQYAIQNDTFAGTMDKLKSALENLAIVFLEQFAPVLRSVAEGLTKVIRVISKAPAALKGVATGATFAAVAVKSLGLAFGVALGPIGLVVTGVTALVGGMVALNNEVERKRALRLSEQFETLGKTFGETGAELEEFIQKAGVVEEALNIALRTSGPLVDFNVGGSFSSALDSVRALAKEMDLSVDQVLEIGLKSKNITDEYKEQLQLVKDQLEATEDLTLLLDDRELAEYYRRQNILAVKRKELQIAQEKKEVEEAEAEVLERQKDLMSQIGVLDQLRTGGGISEEDWLKEKIKLRKAEIETLRKTAIAEKKATKETINKIKTQQSAINRYEKELKKIEKTQDDLNEKEKEAERIALEKIEIEEDYARRRQEQTFTRIQLLDAEEKLVLAAAESVEAKTTDIVDYYAKRRADIVEEEEDAKTATRLDSIKDLEEMTTLAVANISAVVNGSLGDMYDALADSLMAVGQASGSTEIMVAAMVLKLGKAIFDFFDESEWEENFKKLQEEISSEIADIALKERKRTLDEEYELEEKAINERYQLAVDAIQEEQRERLQSLGIIERSALESIDNQKEKAIESLAERLIEEEDAEKVFIDEILNERLSVIEKEKEEKLSALDEAYLKEKEQLGQLSEAEQQLVDYKADLRDKADQQERDDNLKKLERLRADGKTSEAEKLQDHIDSQDKLKQLEIDAEKAKEDRKDKLSDLEDSRIKTAGDREKEKNRIELDAEKASEIAFNDSQDRRLEKIKSVYSSEFEELENIFAARVNMENELTELEIKNQERQKKFRYDKAVADKSAKISEIYANQNRAISELSWWEINVQDKDDDIKAEYAKLVDAVRAVPLPEMKTGGVVFASPGGTLTRQAENGYDEVDINMGPSGTRVIETLADKINNAGGGGGTIIAKLIVDGKELTEVVAKYANNGEVEFRL